MIDTLLNAALAKYGTGAVLAQEIGVSPSEITTFRSGDAGLKIHHLKKLFDISGLTLTSVKEKESLINAALTFANLYQEKK
ncbi:hypothetical protein [Desulfobacter postgatei]|uniref:hypothetical protein n=1 Tax=Desulfobacter postgatei TaxID=2293 RepID=UPI002FDA4F95